MEFRGSGVKWTYWTNTNRPKDKQGVLVDKGNWNLSFGEKRFIFRKFNFNKSPFADGVSFIKALKNRGFEELGSGAFSTVLAKPGQKRVIKVIRRPDGWIDYVHWGAQKGSSFIPRVFSYKKIKGKERNFEVAIVERLEYTFSKVPKDHALSMLPDLMYRSESNPMAARFMEILAPGLKDFVADVRKEFEDHLDLHSGNLMVRKDGSFVLADPVCSGPKTEYQRLKAGDFSPALLERRIYCNA